MLRFELICILLSDFTWQGGSSNSTPKQSWWMSSDQNDDECCVRFKYNEKESKHQLANKPCNRDTRFICERPDREYIMPTVREEEYRWLLSLLLFSSLKDDMPSVFILSGWHCFLALRHCSLFLALCEFLLDWIIT